MIPDTHSEADLPARIVRWLEDQGYPLEMRTAQAFQHEGFTVQQGHYFRDSDENKYRELDLVAELSYECHGRPLFANVHVECKLAASKPWLIFEDTTRSILPETDVLLWSITPHAERLGRTILREVISARREDLNRTTVFQLPLDTEGYSVIESLKSRAQAPDPAFAALRKLAKSITCVRENPPVEYDCYWFAFALLVVEGPLFAARLDAEGGVSVSPVTSASVTVDVEPGTGVWPCPVSIVRFPAVRVFAAKYKEIMKAILAEFGSQIREYLPAEPTDNA